LLRASAQCEYVTKAVVAFSLAPYRDGLTLEQLDDVTEFCGHPAVAGRLGLSPLQEVDRVIHGHCRGGLDFLAEETPSEVPLDINLGEGADFRVAAVLSKRKISFVFAAGYDRETIPAESSSITCL